MQKLQDNLSRKKKKDQKDLQLWLGAIYQMNSST